MKALAYVALVLLGGCTLVVDGDYTSGGIDSGDRPPDGGRDGGRDAMPGRPDADAGSEPTLAERCTNRYGAQVPVAGIAALRAQIPAMYGSAMASADRPVTGDIRLTGGDLFVEADSIALPMDPECSGSSTTCGIDPRVVGTIPGVEYVPDLRRVVLRNGAIFRLRFGLEFFRTGIAAVIQVEPPCASECPRGADRCMRDFSCYQAGETACLECDARPRPQCACVERAEGDECQVLFGDAVMFGMCRAGTCANE